jgi:branched-subunit amino acid aminotransferase/4-amino-4-deoxychorismate lyase
MAAAEAQDRGAEESLLLNTDGFVNEGSTSNVFWIQDGVVCTPPLRFGVLPGVTRAVILELCETLKIPQRDDAIQSANLPQCDGVFLSLTSRGIVEAEALDGIPLRRSPVTQQLREAFERLLVEECGPRG